MDLYTSLAGSQEFPYIVNIQNQHVISYSMSVGILIQANLVLTTCNLFMFSVYGTKKVEEDRFLDFRIMISNGDLVRDPEAFQPTRPQARFIENVLLHPDCNPSSPTPAFDGFRVWRKDLAIVRLSFSFDLGPEELILIPFNRALSEKRLGKLTDMYNRSVCVVVGWGRTLTIGDPHDFFTGSTTFLPSHHLLKSTVRLVPLELCERHCKQNPMLCDLRNQTKSGRLVCAERTTREIIIGGDNLSHFPCTGSEGSPLICYDADNSSDIYGVLSYLPDDSCANQWPLVFTRIDEVSEFIISVIGKAEKFGRTSMQLMLPITIHLTINYHSQYNYFII